MRREKKRGCKGAIGEGKTRESDQKGPGEWMVEALKGTLGSE